MRLFLTRVVLSLLASAGVILLAPGTATADPVCQVTDPQTGQCLIWVGTDPEPPTPGDPVDNEPASTGPGRGCHWDPTKHGLVRPPAGPVPCNSEQGYWSNVYNCYIKRLDPQPPPTAPFWEGAYVEGGAVYQCYQPQTDMVVSLWLPEPPLGSGAGPTPGEVAQMAVDRMNLRAIHIGIAPEPRPGSVGLVGMPVWMWVADPDPHTFGPATASASAGGVSVTATARVEGITWEMGDGTEVVCTSAGTPYLSTFGNKSSPDCGHTYTTSSAGQPNDRFTVTARSDWVITWQGAGQSGTIRLDGLERSVQIAVGEAQVLVS